MNSILETVISADGTAIAVERIGEGPPVVLVGGAFNDRTTVAGLAVTLAAQLTAVIYDRRGRGASGDKPDYSLQAEIDDLTTVIAHAGGRAGVFGHSSGAVLALEAAARGVSIDRIAVYEPTFVIEGTRPRPAADLADRLRTLLALGRHDDGAALFLTESVGLPPEMVEGMRASPMWGRFTDLAHTLPYDVTICGPGMVFPIDRLAAIHVPTLALVGSNSPERLQASTRAVADAIPDAQFVTVEQPGIPSVSILASDVYEWLPGRFFVLHSAYGRIGDFSVGAIEMLWYDPAAGHYRSQLFDHQGNVVDSTLMLEGGVWTWMREGARAFATFNDDGNLQTAHHERSDDGVTWEPSMEVTLTKVE